MLAVDLFCLEKCMTTAAALRSLDLFGPTMLADPYPVYHQLRQIDPVYWHEPFHAWVLTRYDDICAALHDPRFSAERTTQMRAMSGRPELAPFFGFLSSRMNFLDPPRHTRLRGLVSKAFTPHTIEALRPHIQGLVDGFLNAVQGRAELDLMADLAFPLPVTVILELLGVPVADRDRLKHWSDAFVVYFSRDPSQISAEQYQLAVKAVDAERAYFDEAVRPLREQPQNNLLSLMLQVREGSDRLSAEELFANANLMLTAGHETTTNLIGNGMLALLRHPDELAKLRANPGLVPAAVEEMLRYDPPVQFLHRVVKEEVRLHDKVLQPGQFVYLMLGAANRDPARFPDPDRFDISRPHNHHLAFGQGPHYCLGAPLARLEAQIAFATLLRRYPSLELGTTELVYQEGFNLHGVKQLPLRVGAAGSCHNGR